MLTDFKATDKKFGKANEALEFDVRDKQIVKQETSVICIMFAAFKVGLQEIRWKSNAAGSPVGSCLVL